MMKTTLSCGMLLLAAAYFNAQTTGKVGINTNAPKETLEVNGTLKVGNLPTNGTANAIYNGQNAKSTPFTATHMVVADTNGVLGKHSLGTAGQVLMSKGNDSAPEWKSLKEATGVISETQLIEGNSEITVPKGEEKDVPGLTYTITIPKGQEKLVVFNIVGYAAPNDVGGTQGVFELFQDEKKISSAYASGLDSGDKYLRDLKNISKNIPASTVAEKIMSTSPLGRVPIPATLIAQAKLTEGKYTFKVKYKSWYGTSKINVDASSVGYDGATPKIDENNVGDSKALLSKMLISVYNTK